jgi:hypothetical protein
LQFSASVSQPAQYMQIVSANGSATEK